MEYKLSGNDAVDQMAMIDISGNVIHMNWYKTILKETGVAYHLAIQILSDIVFWYRPIEIRDEVSGHLIGYQKRFKEDKLYKTYQAYADLFNDRKKPVKEAFDRLEELGIIEREFRAVKQNGMTFYNVMYIQLNVDRLCEFTFIPKEEVELDSTCGHYVHKLYEKYAKGSQILNLIGGTSEKEPTSLKKEGEVVTKKLIPPYEKVTTPEPKSWEVMTEKETGAYIKVHTSLQKSGEAMTKTEIPLSENVYTNTKNTTEINTENSSSSTGESVQMIIDDEIREVFDGFGISDKGIGCIVSASGFDLSKCRKAAEVLRHQKTPVENIVGWFVHAVREGYSITEMQQYKPEKQKGSFFNFQQKNDYDFDEMRKRIFAN